MFILNKFRVEDFKTRNFKNPKNPIRNFRVARTPRRGCRWWCRHQRPLDCAVSISSGDSLPRSIPEPQPALMPLVGDPERRYRSQRRRAHESAQTHANWNTMNTRTQSRLCRKLSSVFHPRSLFIKEKFTTNWGAITPDMHATLFISECHPKHLERSAI